MKTLYLAKTLVAVAIMVDSLLPPNTTTHEDLVWADDEDQAREILRTEYAKDTDPTRTAITIWLSKALGSPLES